MAWGRFGPARLDDDLPVDDWLDLRNEDVAQRQAYEDAGYGAWADSTETGRNLEAAKPSDVVALGATALNPDDATEDRAAPGVSPTPATPQVRYIRAQPGDSISSLLGTSDPGAVGRFARLNGMEGRNSTIYSGRAYAIPLADDQASRDDTASGWQLLQRQAGARIAPASARDQFTTRLEAGQNVWTGEPVGAGLAVRRPPSLPSVDNAGLLDRINHNEIARTIAREAALKIGQGLGEARGAANIARDSIDMLGFAGRLVDPLDPLFSPPGQSAWRQVGGAIHRGRQIVDGLSQDPRAAIQGLKSRAVEAARGLRPEASPEAETATGEVARVLPIGMNQGELRANIGALFLGGEGAEAARAAGAAAKSFDAARFAEMYPKATEYWDAPYSARGRGSHFFSQNKGKFSYIGGVKVPDWLAKFDVPQFLREPEIFRLRPPEFTNAQMQTRHAIVDPQLHGGKIPAEYGRGWSVRKLGFDARLPPAGRVWYGASPQLKTAVGAGVLGGSVADSYLREWGAPW